MWRLFYPLRYFLLQNKQKRNLDLWPTLVLGALIAFPYIAFSEPSFFGSDGFLDKILPLSSALTAFYVAALVAVATFSHPDLDRVIKVGSIYFIDKDESGREEKDYLTRRQFACLIFGYLAFISLVISVGAAVAITVNGVPVPNITITSLETPFIVETATVINRSLIAIFAASVAHMMVVTALGLYYLMERIHDRQPRIIGLKSAASDEAK